MERNETIARAAVRAATEIAINRNFCPHFSAMIRLQRTELAPTAFDVAAHKR